MWISAFLLIISMLLFTGGYGFIAALFLIASILVFLNSDHDDFDDPNKNKYA